MELLPWGRLFTSGSLKKSLYGIRDAPAKWEAAIKEVMPKIGFIRAKSNSCLYYHEEGQIRVEVHGNDFTALGPKSKLKNTIRKTCKSQAVIALSSGEAEYYGLVSGLCQGFGEQSTLRDWGISIPLIGFMDATTGFAIGLDPDMVLDESSISTRFSSGHRK